MQKEYFSYSLQALIFNFGVIAFLNRGDTLPSGLSGFPMLLFWLLKTRDTETEINILP